MVVAPSQELATAASGLTGVVAELADERRQRGTEMAAFRADLRAELAEVKMTVREHEEEQLNWVLVRADERIGAIVAKQSEEVGVATQQVSPFAVRPLPSDEGAADSRSSHGRKPVNFRSS